MTRALAVEWAPSGIRVNAVAPTWVRTNLTAPLLDQPGIVERIAALTPLKRLATPDEIAGRSFTWRAPPRRWSPATRSRSTAAFWPNSGRARAGKSCIVPNAFAIPDIRAAGTVPKRRERGSELSWAVPIDNEHVTVEHRRLAARRRYTEERLAARRRHGSGNPARFRPNQEIRGSPAKARLSRGAEVTATDRQPRPGNLGTSDTGITILRHLLQKQVKTGGGRPRSYERRAGHACQPKDPD
jgi:hypothetical protein